MHELLAETRRARVDAIRELPPTHELAYALRRVLFADRDAEVRAAAARRLATLEHTAIAGWLRDALADRSPLVRDAILRALAKVGDATCRDAVRTHTSDDRMWWVRRTAIYALAALAGADEVAAFRAALADPFWRVRHAAVKVLAALGARDLDVRALITDDAAPANTLSFLRAAWGPTIIEAPQRALSDSQLPAALLDPDPAVVTARLAADPTLASPVALVELLSDPHAPLRLLAAHLIFESNDAAAYRAALDWLEEPRIPHVADTVERLLDKLGDAAVEIATHALSRTDRFGAARWAINWVVATKYEPLYESALTRARDDARLRPGALRLAANDELVAWAAPALLDAIATELHERRAPQAHAALLSLDARAHARARTLQLDAAARRGDDIAHAMTDAHHGPRAVAAWWTKAPDAIRDPDPAVREAALTRDNATQLADDLDPWVARAALARLVEAYRTRSELPANVAACAARARRSRDPKLRADACRLPIVDDAALASVLGLVIDPDEMVRSAALEALAHVPNAEARIAALVEQTNETPPNHAVTDMARAERANDVAADMPRGQRETPPNHVVADMARADADTRVARVELDHDALRVARALLHGEAAPRPVRAPRVSAPSVAPAVVERRRFGRADLAIAPLVVSGAYDIAAPALAAATAAGVDTFFWEPSYRALTQYLRRRPELRVIAGSYHADARSIEADIDSALKKLRRDTLDVFLLFWSRSPARVDAGAFAMLDAIRRTGKVRMIGFSTHHRALARAAIETSAWDVVMIRHSAAHPGIESEVLPTARERGTAILTFSTLCYGRMTSGPNAPIAADCIRYSLAQAGVTAVVNAPRRYRDVVERLDVLRAAPLSPDQIAALRSHGALVRAESQRFNTLMRQPTRDAAAAAREMLAAELPPSHEIQQRALPKPSSARAARTNLGTTRRR